MCVDDVDGHLDGVELEAVLGGHLEHAEVDLRVLVAGEADVADLAGVARGYMAAWMAPSSAKMRSGSSKRRISWNWTRSITSVSRRPMDCSELLVVVLGGAGVELGHDEDLVAVAVLKGLTHTDFGDAVVVVPAVVEEGDAAVHCLVDQVDHLVLLLGDVGSFAHDGSRPGR